tara:strand:+ start:329 stop:520 length:192 start_codon:yes stop_codon:yes gene_type:complete
MIKMNITAAKYAPNHPITGEASKSVFATIDGVELHVPADAGNRHYAEIMRQVASGELTIADAD